MRLALVLLLLSAGLAWAMDGMIQSVAQHPLGGFGQLDDSTTAAQSGGGVPPAPPVPMVTPAVFPELFD
jgi:hypothetical protein